MGVARCGATEGDYLGQGNVGDCRRPTRIESLAGRVVHAAAGEIMMGCVTRDDQVYTWGDNDQSSLGIGGREQHQDVPHIVDALTGRNTQHLRFSFGNSAAVTADSRLFLWGTEGGKWRTTPGLNTPIPQEFNLGSSESTCKVLECVVGPRHTLAIAYNRSHQLAGAEASLDLCPV
mmetsp:Transcript_49041/g.129575  ORF Transcript_49041/g.129575 Transcript_49041/m.129575 type:complete len:176 (+) Transcript_49041:598-1125(+)